ncbi:hypothetical protein B0A49_13672, partial [Cryomyces minteri]
MVSQRRARLASPAIASTGSLTQTQAEVGPSIIPNLPSGTLRLRAVSNADALEERHIQWAEGTIDNESMGKKSSKGDSSSESSSDSSSSEDGGSD